MRPLGVYPSAQDELDCFILKDFACVASRSRVWVRFREARYQAAIGGVVGHQLSVD